MTPPYGSRIGRQFHTTHEAQLNIYASEFARLHRFLRARATNWMEAEQHLRTRGTHAETIHQVLAAAYTISQIALDETLPPDARVRAGQRLPAILERGLQTMRDYRAKMGSHAHDDLGIVAVLRSEIRTRAATHGWKAQFNTANVDSFRASAISETAAYLAVCEALDYASANPCTRRVLMTVAGAHDRLRIELIIDVGDATSELAGTANHPAVPLTRLYARRAGGTCTWDRRSATNGRVGGSKRIEILLPCAPTVEGLGPDSARKTT